MSDVSKTNELIAEARDARHMGLAGYTQSEMRYIFEQLADALETVTRVPVQGEPNDDRETILKKALEHVREVGESGLAGAYVHNLPKDVDSNWGWLQTMWPVVIAVDTALASRATVPDAVTEELEDQITFLNELLIKKLTRQRDASLAAIERVRAIAEKWRYGLPEYTSSSYQEGQKDQQRRLVGELLAALDGAPEPEVKP